MFWLRTKDHPGRNGRDGKPGEFSWNIDFETDTGQKVRIHIGAESRTEILAMLAKDGREMPPLERRNPDDRGNGEE
jgi:hypothetical protein